MSARTRRARARPGQHLAARFCAKEAVAKALGLTALSWRDVEVVSDGRRARRCSCTAPPRGAPRSLGVVVRVSLTHTRTDAGAVAVTERAVSGRLANRLSLRRLADTAARRRAAARDRPVGDRGARDSRDRADGARRRRPRASSSTRPCPRAAWRSSAARATTAVMGSWSRGCCATGAATSTCCCSARPTSSAGTRATNLERLPGPRRCARSMPAALRAAPARSSTRSSAPGSRASRAIRRAARSRRSTRPPATR